MSIVRLESTSLKCLPLFWLVRMPIPHPPKTFINGGGSLSDWWEMNSSLVKIYNKDAIIIVTTFLLCNLVWQVQCLSPYVTLCAQVSILVQLWWSPPGIPRPTARAITWIYISQHLQHPIQVTDDCIAHPNIPSTGLSIGQDCTASWMPPTLAWTNNKNAFKSYSCTRMWCFHLWGGPWQSILMWLKKKVP